MESNLYENLLENYIGLTEEYIRKNRFLIYEVLKRANGVKAEVKLSAMLLSRHKG